MYDFGANVGDEWTITAGENSVTVHVDKIDYYIKNARWFKVLEISDADDVFTGTIACSVGHLTSFFPERLLNKGNDFSVDGIRCYWKNDILLLKEGDTDCDYIYNNYHFDVEENNETTFTVYPNPSNGSLYIDSAATQEYLIINVIGQTVHSGMIADEHQQIEISHLPNGIYFLKIGGYSQKLIIRK